jgi:hypothetical protein
MELNELGRTREEIAKVTGVRRGPSSTANRRGGVKIRSLEVLGPLEMPVDICWRESTNG